MRKNKEIDQLQQQNNELQRKIKELQNQSLQKETNNSGIEDKVVKLK